MLGLCTLVLLGALLCAPAGSGLTVREAFLAAEMLAESGRVVSLDMVEVNPMLDAFNKTGALACELILSVLGKTVY